MADPTQTASEYILDTSREYSIYVCEHRAIPKVTDGLKDGQRKALWLMRNRADKIKTISLAGEMISSNLYLHGDASAAGAISLLAAPFTNNIPYLEGEGTFGTKVAPVEGISAPRYTYVRRGKAAEKLMFRDLDIVPLKENYDGSTMEPVTFLPIIPVVLLNGVSGVAVGWSTEILPRRLDDLIEATIKAIDGVKPRKRIEPYYSYLDIDVKHLEDNTWEMSGKLQIISTSCIKITELPPGLTVDKFIKQLIDLETAGKINDFTDNSTEVIDIEVKFKRGSLKGWTEDKALNFFKLQKKKTERIVIIGWEGDAIKQYDNAESLVVDFVEWRLKHYINRYQKLFDDTSYELLYWLGLKACFDADLPNDLIKTKDKASIEKKVEQTTKKLGLDDKQIDRIVSLPTYRWAKDHYQVCKEKIKELTADQTEYQRLLNNPDDIRKIFRQEVLDLRKAKLEQ